MPRTTVVVTRKGRAGAITKIARLGIVSIPIDEAECESACSPAFSGRVQSFSCAAFGDGEVRHLHHCFGMGDLMLAFSSAALGTFIWLGVIAVVMICLIILGFVGLTTHDKTKT